MTTFVKNNKFLLIIFGSAIFIVVLLAALIGGALWDEEQKNVNNCATNSSDFKDSKITGGQGDWGKQGTRAYNTAKQVWEYWVAYGMNGAQVGGIVGNIGGAENKAFVLDLKEYSGGGGGGLYQFTPYTKYLKGSDGSWSVKSQSDFVVKSEPASVKRYMSTTQNKSPETAAIAWMNIYERPSAAARTASSGARQSAARKAYQLFGGDKIKGKSSTLSSAINAATDATIESQSNCDDDDMPSSGEWGWPFKGMSYKSAKAIIKNEPYQGFGYTGGGRVNGYHDGVDFGTARYNNQTINAIHGGKVTKIAHSGTTNDTLGWYVWVTSSDGWNEIYQEFGFSNSDKQYIKVKVGQNVKTGDAIGYLTAHGNVNHVHIGVTKKSFENAISHSFDPSGGWKDPLEIINNGLKQSSDKSDKNDKNNKNDKNDKK